jgi:hypothetical protein
MLFALTLQACSPSSMPRPTAAPAQATGAQSASATPTATIEFDVLFEDNFSDSDSGWAKNEVTSGHTADYQDDTYWISVSKAHNGTDIPLGPPAGVQTNGLPLFSDVRIEADVLAGANLPVAVGLNCREQPDRENFYMASITESGEFYISKLEDDHWDTLNTGVSEKITLAWGKNVRLRFDCIGPQLDLFVNGELVASANDSTFTKGGVGLYVEAGDSPGEAFFDNFVVMGPKTEGNSEGAETPAVNTSAGGGTGKLVYASYQNDDTFQIFSMNADGSNQVQLVPSEPRSATQMSQPRNNYYPEYSADGALLTFWNVDSVTFTDAQVCCRDVYVLRLLREDGTTVDLMLPAGDSRTSWSPDGNSIAFAGYLEGAAQSDIAIFNLTTQAITFLTSDPDSDQQPAWSPDGTTLIYSHFSAGLPLLYSMRADGSDQRVFETGTVNASEADWSPDGSQIAFVVYFADSSQIFAINADGSGLVQLTDANGYSQSPDWSPDGSLIAFSLNNQIYVMNADGSNPINISNNDFHEETPTWQAIGD